MFKISCRRDEMIVVADLEGVFDHNAEDEVEKGLLQGPCAPKGEDSVIWNFKGVTELTSSGIAILINACKDLEKKHKILKSDKKQSGEDKDKKAFSRVKLSDLRSCVLDALEVHRLAGAFDIKSDEVAAVKQIRIDLEESGVGNVYTRLFERIDVQLKASFKEFRDGGRSDIPCIYSADVKTLSRCGIYLHTKDVEDTSVAGSVLDVDLILYDDRERGTGSVYHADAKTIAVNFVGKVVWEASKEQADIYPGMALSIVSMEEDVKNMLEGYLGSRGV